MFYILELKEDFWLLLSLSWDTETTMLTPSRMREHMEKNLISLTGSQYQLPDMWMRPFGPSTSRWAWNACSYTSDSYQDQQKNYLNCHPVKSSEIINHSNIKLLIWGIVCYIAKDYWISESSVKENLFSEQGKKLTFASKRVIGGISIPRHSDTRIHPNSYISFLRVPLFSSHCINFHQNT